MQKVIVSNDVSDLNAVANELIDFCESDKIYAFYGEMGVGKTTIIQAICKTLGVTDPVVSPSYSIINEYVTNGEIPEPVYHFDFYRVKSLKEIYDVGYEDYLYSGYRCFIEWPEKIETLLPPNYVQVIIETHDEEDKSVKRVISIQRILKK